MSVRVITTVDAVRYRHGFARVAGALAGWILVLAGLLVAVPMFGLIVVSLTVGSSADNDFGSLLLYAALGTAAVIGGRRLVRGKRRLILFLRRFGFTGSSRAVSFSVGTAAGRRFRAVTLDDNQLAPVAARWWVRWLLALASLASAVLLVFIVRDAAEWLAGDALGEVFRSTFTGTRSSALEQGENPVGAFIGGLVVAIIISMVAGILALGVLILLFAVIGSSLAVSATSWIGVIRSELGKRPTVREPRAVERAALRVAKRARGIFAPRLVVLRAAGAVWRDTVKRLAGVADIVLIDVSVPSDNLLWEISTLKPDCGNRWILTCETGRVADLANGAGTAGQARQLAHLLDGQDVLAYDTDSRKSLRQFARALRASCERIAAREE
jgi:hypothetical protein